MDEDEYEDNMQQQQEELDAVAAIYGEDCTVWMPERRCEVWLPSREATPCIVLRTVMPPTYPSRNPPQFDVEARHLEPTLLQWMVQQLEEQVVERGCVCLFTVAEWIKEQEVLFQTSEPHGSLQAEQEQTRSAAVANSPPAVSLNRMEGIVTAEVFTEKRSKFQAHLCSVHTVDEVQAVMDTLLENNKIRNATHNIMAYRIHCAEKDTFIQDYDEDGETAAGGRLLHLLQIVDARDVVVVVSRWYGGIKLGPARFTHINNAARELLVTEGYVKQGGDAASGGKHGSKLATATKEAKR